MVVGVSTDDDASHKAFAEKRPLMIWVKDCPARLKAQFPEAVHVCVPSYRGDSSARLIVPGRDGWLYYWADPDAQAERSVRQLLRSQGYAWLGVDLAANRNAVCVT